LPVSVIAFSASSASMICWAQHQPAGTAPLLGGGMGEVMVDHRDQLAQQVGVAQRMRRRR
jgi:hypothetical protein